MLKNHRTFFALLLAFYAGLGILTAVLLKPIVTETRAYKEFNPDTRSVFATLPYGDLKKQEAVSSAPAGSVPAEPADASGSKTEAPVAETLPSDPKEPAAAPAEEETVPDTPASPDTAERKYYSFVTANVEQILYVRTQPGLDKKSVARLKPGTKGYVLQEGPNWCYILAGDIIGFSSTEYLTLTEVPKEQFPQEYLGIVSPFPLDVPNK